MGISDPKFISKDSEPQTWNFSFLDLFQGSLELRSDRGPEGFSDWAGLLLLIAFQLNRFVSSLADYIFPLKFFSIGCKVQLYITMKTNI